MEYEEFLETKKMKFDNVGMEINQEVIHPILFPFQKDIVKWAVKKGRCAVFLDTGLGKALSTDTNVMAPHGPKKMGRINVGDDVCGKNGLPVRVSGVYPQGEREAYQVTFSDGASVTCDLNHLWSVRTKVQKYRKQNYRTMTTAEIMTSGLVSQKGWKWFIPMAKPLQFIPDALLPIAPYLLGCLIGDGSLTHGTPGISSVDDELLSKVALLLPPGLQIKYRSGCDWALTQGRRNGHSPNTLTEKLKALGLYGSRSEDKFIPSGYLFSSISDRVDLLQGLMDTDGYASPDGTVSFCTVSPQLARDVALLVQTLGGKAPIRQKKTSGQLAYEMSLALPNEILPFSLTRKANIRKERIKYFPARAIVSIEPCGTKEMVCISVDAEDSLYVIDHCIVTHNTFIQLEWARLNGKKTLIVAPLSVARQTIREAKKIDIQVTYVRNSDSMTGGINITNYEMIEWFSSDSVGAIILDESSILKSISGKTRQKLIDQFRDVPFKLCCTATPAPNDYIELGNHAAFLNVCSMQEMLSMFFINANKEHTFIFENTIITKKGTNKGGQEWRLKHHAEDSFFRWLPKWSIVMTKPSDLGYMDNGFILPELKINPIFVKTSYSSNKNLFFLGLSGIEDRMSVRKNSISEKAEIIKELVDHTQDQWIIWCGLDKESQAAKNSLNGITREVKGTDDPESKVKNFEDFQDGKFKVLVTKAKIGGYGMNFQNANNTIFFGLNDSWETWYQAIRREWRFGQTKPVNVYILLSELEREIYDNILRKDKMAQRLKVKMIGLLKDYEREEVHGMKIKKDDYIEKTVEKIKFKAMLGDSSVRLKEIVDNTIHLSVYSPPFADLFVYSNSERDLGNSRGWEEFFKHYEFIVKEIFRSTMIGRLSCVHTSDIPAMANRDGYIGLRDFPGEVIKLHERCGWTFVGRAFIQKNPQSQAIRTKCKPLMFVQLNKDSSHSRPALIDQILIFKKPGENSIPITPVKNGELDNEMWISWAHGIWFDINETDTLQYYIARDRDDEKHICPLQLGTIERCIKLYSNPGETILTPFMGIGSEAFMAVKLGRKAVGIELKESYFNVAVNNLNSIQDDLFGLALKTS
jgi:hypothetical protein